MKKRLNQSQYNKGLGSGGYCICSNCNTRVKHKSGIPCNEHICPNCGETMTRESQKNNTNYDSSSKSLNKSQPKIDENICLGCGLCISSCPFGAIKLVNGIAQIDYTLCKGCKRCISSCPQNAIRI